MEQVSEPLLAALSFEPKARGALHAAVIENWLRSSVGIEVGLSNADEGMRLDMLSRVARLQYVPPDSEVAVQGDSANFLVVIHGQLSEYECDVADASRASMLAELLSQRKTSQMDSSVAKLRREISDRRRARVSEEEKIAVEKVSLRRRLELEH